uniref:Uncharacterized protein n=1 Tax=viral metagenome TaxID=1070528 RepID=A0A6M3IXW1_9ZZZZ
MKRGIVGLILVTTFLALPALAEETCIHHNSIAFEFDLCFDSAFGQSTGTKTWYRIFDVPQVAMPQEQRTQTFSVISAELPGPFRLIQMDDGGLKYLIEYQGQFYSVNPNPLSIMR